MDARSGLVLMDDWDDDMIQEWDAFHAQFDDDPSPYDGTYSEE
jgi:hypothetical protein